MQEQTKKALDDLVKMLNGDPEALLALKGIVDTADKSKALDEEGVVRKAVSPKDEECDPEDEMDEEGKEGKKKPAEKSIPANVVAEPSDEVLEGIAAFVRDEVKTSENGIIKALTDLSTVLESVMDRLEAVEQAEATVKQLTETPRSVAERLKALSAARSPETVVKADDPIKDKRPQSQGNDILAQLLGRGV